ncbi:MAG: molybdopterin oxidoreductase [Denitrovibrio sp.]|nr:MAG: molybdopterin oxidoreductase [Denitrovibrio sp.]
MVHQEAFEWYIAVYLFLAGVGAGSMVVAAVADMYDREKYLSFIKAASLIGMPLVSIGIFFLYIDLGQGMWKPWLLIFLFANPASAITWGTAILTIFTILSFIYGAYNLGYLKIGCSRCLNWLLIITGICTAGYTAVLLGSLKAIPFWHQTALPILFIISATSTGISGAMIVKLIFLKSDANIKPIETAHLYLIVLEIIMLIGMMLIALQGVPEMKYAAESLLFGDYAFLFWFLLVFTGLLVPAIAFGMEEAHKLHMKTKTVVTLEIMVLLGGYLMRYLIIHAGVYTKKFAEYIVR